MSMSIVVNSRFAMTYLVLSLTFTLGILTARAHGEQKHASHVLDRRVLHNGKRSLEVVAHYDLDTQMHGQVMEAFTVKNLRIDVLLHGVGYNDSRRIFSKTFDRKWSTPPTTTLAPLWNQQYVPTANFVLPTARLAADSEACVLVLFDGKTMRGYRLNEERSEFIAFDHATPAERRCIDGLFDEFTPHDVYWCYGLITCGEFFHRENKTVSFAQFVDGGVLHTLWKSMQ